MATVTTTLPPCPNCKLDMGRIVTATRASAGRPRKTWGVECTACGAQVEKMFNKSRAVAFWSKGEFYTPFDTARAIRDLNKTPVFRHSLHWPGGTPSRFPLIARLCSGLCIQFCPGEYGRVDKFYLGEHFLLSSHPSICHVELTTQSGDETLVVLHELDVLVAYDPGLIVVTLPSGGWLWFLFEGKTAAHRRATNAAALYQRRRHEQERVLKGELKRGHKAFGFFPLEGYR